MTGATTIFAAKEIITMKSAQPAATHVAVREPDLEWATWRNVRRAFTLTSPRRWSPIPVDLKPCRSV